MNRRLRGNICLQEKPAAGRENLQTSKCILSVVVVVGVSNPLTEVMRLLLKALN